MINLMPPPAKEQLRFSKYNRQMLHYIQLVLLVVLVLAAIFAAAIYYLDHQVKLIGTDLTSKQEAIAKYAPDKAVAVDAATRLNAIKQIKATQTRFSQLLYDLAAVLPKGVSISGIALTGDAAKPVIVSVSGGSYDEVLAFRDTIVTSPRIAGADMQNITQTETGYQANVVLGFKPGEAK